jgi:hypothetical protein
MIDIESTSAYTLFAFEKPEEVDDLILLLLDHKKKLRNNFPMALMVWSDPLSVIHLSEEEKIKITKEKLDLFIKKTKPPDNSLGGFNFTVVNNM